MTDARPHIQSVQFRPDGVVEIAYSEPGEQGDHIAVMRIVMFDETEAGAMLVEVQDTLADLLDAMLIKMKAPPRRRM